jgi:tryptophan synthase alpha chain
MNRLETAFAKMRLERRTGLIAYVCAGDPDLALTVRIVPRLVAAGAEVVELGVPFSDPVADGPVIQAAGQRALAAGTTLAKVLDAAEAIRSAGCEAPLVLMTYLNPILSLRVDTFCARAKEAGIDGVIVPDLPHDEGEELAHAASEAGIDRVLLAAPTTSPARLAEIGERSRGFLYFVTVTGVTGVRSALPPELPSQLARARAAARVPVAAGFGISSPQQARELSQHADAIVVGSAIVRALASGEGGEARATALLTGMSEALGR